MTGAWFAYFWTNPAAGIPADLAFGLFSTAHLFTLAGLAVLIGLLVVVYRRCGPARRRLIRLVIGVTVGLLEVGRQLAYLLLGFYDPAILPLHLCAVATFCVLIDSIRPNSWCRQFIYALGTWGPVCALLFADWAGQPWFNIYTWQAFIIHACLFGYALMLLVSGELRPDARQLWKVIAITAVAVGLSLLANHVWGTNFWFLNTGSPGSPLDPLQQLTGAFYIPTLLVLLAIIWAAMYIPWRRRGADSRVPAP